MACEIQTHKKSPPSTQNRIVMTQRTSTKVSFANVEIREYARCLGNNPTLHHDGPSLSIDWKYKCKRTVSLDQYEQMKDKRSQTRALLHQKPLSFSSKKLQRLSGPIRWRIIQEHTKCTKEEIDANIEASYQTDRERQLCFENQDFEAIHIVLESTERKLRRFRQRLTKSYKQAKDHHKHQQQKQQRSKWNQISPVGPEMSPKNEFDTHNKSTKQVMKIKQRGLRI